MVRERLIGAVQSGDISTQNPLVEVDELVDAFGRPQYSCFSITLVVDQSI
jgi:hypothetical protein